VVVLGLVRAVRASQHNQWGEQKLEHGIRSPGDYENEVAAKTICARKPTWRNVLVEEIAEACNARDDKHLEQELVQVAAVAVAWIEAIRDGRSV
jgi:hypothetical protein